MVILRMKIRQIEEAAQQRHRSDRCHQNQQIPQSAGGGLGQQAARRLPKHRQRLQDQQARQWLCLQILRGRSPSRRSKLQSRQGLGDEKIIKLKNNNDANASHTQNQNTQHHKRRTNNNKETRNTTNEKQTTTKEQTQNPCMKVMQKAESALRVAARVSRSACQTFEDTVTSI